LQVRSRERRHRHARRYLPQRLSRRANPETPRHRDGHSCGAPRATSEDCVSDRRSMSATEAERRASRTDRVEELFRERAVEWVTVADLMKAGGICAWRTRVADARHRFKTADAGVIEWNGDVHDSKYRYLPYTPLGRDGGTLVPQRSLF